MQRKRQQLTVIRARAMGMCFGVRDALAVTDGLKDPETVTILGELVHNDEVLSGLSDRGFKMTSESERDQMPGTENVMITAHGVSKKEEDRLRGAGKLLIDTTCPLVKAVHKAATELHAEGRFIVVIGKPRHVEVLGIVGDLERQTVVDRPEDVDSWDASRLGVVCQSTTPPAHAQRMRVLIERKNPDADIRYVDSICAPTRAHQEAIEELLSQVEAVVVVGGLNSNNTRELVRKAEARGLPAVHIQTAHDLDPAWFQAFTRIGLTAGTSTPQQTIEAVHERLQVI